MFSKLNVFAFIVSFCLGIFYVYISSPTPNIVMKFPSPYNTGKVIYKNKAEECYKYNHEKVDCDSNVNVQVQPVFENFNS
tara:strand:+ start:936 stop:1175 length:240 start_codon:yes stop_codon:yes gene_type:complete